MLKKFLFRIEIPIVLITFIFGLEILGFFTVNMLQLKESVYPWTVMFLLADGIYFPELILILLSGFLIFGFHAFFIGGPRRIIGLWCILIIVGFIVANCLGVLLFKAWSHLAIPVTPQMSYTLLHYLNPKSVNYHHFLVCLLFSYLILLLILFMAFFLKKNTKSALGSAHFSNAFEIKKSGLFSKTGIVLGKAYGKILKLPGFESVLVTAPTGAGKTTSIAIPNLIEWEGSGIFNDLKGELYEQTANYREKVLGNACYRFCPSDTKMNTHGYNPFYYVSENPNLRIRDLQLIAETLIPSDRTDGGFWSSSSREIFLMLSIYLFERDGIATLAEIHDLSKQADFIEWLQLTLKKKEIDNEVFEQCAYSLLNADPEKTQKNILKDFHSRMNLFMDPLVRNATSKNDFDLSEMRKKKMSLYLHISDSDKQRLKPILTLLWAQFIHLMTEKEPDPKNEPYPVLAILDEFGNMAKIEKLKEGMCFFRSYRIRAIVIVQYLSQIIETYGQHGSKGFLNSKVKIAFALNDIQDANFFSECLGKKTIEVESNSTSFGKHHSSSKNKSLQAHPLMAPDEIMSMNPDSEIILIEARPPIKAKKYPWFKNRKYQDRLNCSDYKS